MDTDDLSTEAYRAVIVEAERFMHDLTLHFGVLASDCKDEKEYLTQAKQLAEGILKVDDFILEDLFFGSIPDKTKLNLALREIISNIEEVKKIPMDKRHFEF
jgi:hypothetical protein